MLWIYNIVSHNLIRKICFIGNSKSYPSHYIDNHALIAPSNYMKQFLHFISHFGKTCIPYLKIGRSVAVKIVKYVILYALLYLILIGAPKSSGVLQFKFSVSRRLRRYFIGNR